VITLPLTGVPTGIASTIVPAPLFFSQTCQPTAETTAVMRIADIVDYTDKPELCSYT